MTVVDYLEEEGILSTLNKGFEDVVNWLKSVSPDVGSALIETVEEKSNKGKKIEAIIGAYENASKNAFPEEVSRKPIIAIDSFLPKFKMPNLPVIPKWARVTGVVLVMIILEIIVFFMPGGILDLIKPIGIFHVVTIVSASATISLTYTSVFLSKDFARALLSLASAIIFVAGYISY